jgi:hypothetical protein
MNCICYSTIFYLNENDKLNKIIFYDLVNESDKNSVSY